jgi:hypothetical protein
VPCEGVSHSRYIIEKLRATVLPDYFMAAKFAGWLALGDTTLKVELAALDKSCPCFDEELPYRVCSPVSVEVFRIFVGAIEGTPPVLTTENVNDLFLLCEEFGFASLFSQVSDFISAHSVVDSEAPKGATDIIEENLQIKEALCPLQEVLLGVQNANLHLARGNESLQRSLWLLHKEVVDLRAANKVQMEDIAEIREERSREAAELSRLGGKIASLAQASRFQKQEIVALGCAQAKSNTEMCELRAQFVQELMNHVREREAMKREMAELREAQKREIAALRGEIMERDGGLGEQLAIVQKVQKALRQQLADSNGVQPRENAARMEAIGGLRNQQEKIAQELGNLKRQLVQLDDAQSRSDKQIDELNGQVTPKIENLAQDLGNLKQQLTQA